MSTDHTSGMPPFDLGTSQIEVDQNSLPIQNVSPSSDADSESSHGTTIPGPATEAVEFRVIRPGVPVRRLRLTGNRYTFGSADGCSIRLNDSTLRPMHAVLIRDAHRVLVRAYSVPLEVNGNRVTETSLRLGDVMRLGAYRFELLSGVDPAAEPEMAIPQSDQLPVAPPSSPVPPTMAGYPVASMQSMQDRGVQMPATPGMSPVIPGPSAPPVSPVPSVPSEAEQRAYRARLQQETAQWRLRQSEIDVRENRIVERESELRAREAELWARTDQIHRRESQLVSQESAALQIQEEFLARKQELAQLREESRVQQELLDERQVQYQSMESEYRSQIDHATEQLRQSQEQAENATQAVQRMRDQFASLNEQLETLTRQQQELEAKDGSHLEQHRQIREELETARDSAIDARAESEAKRQMAEERVAELVQQLEAYEQDTTATDQLAESEAVAGQLREQIEELQSRVREATAEASQLREDYEGAQATIRQLELLVDQTTGERDEARSHLDTESEALRDSVQQLTSDLEKANAELQELRQANEDLVRELDGVRADRDAAKAETETRPTTDAWDALRVELDQANERIEQMQREYDETLNQATNSSVEANDDSSDGMGATTMGAVAGTALGLVGTLVTESDQQESESEVTSHESTDESLSAESELTAEHQTAEHQAAEHQAGEHDSDAQPHESPASAGDEIWRPEAEQSVENSGHVTAWTEDSSEAPEWQEESPEVAVNEAIADIEQNVDEAIGHLENISTESTDSETEAPVAESYDSTDVDSNSGPWSTEESLDHSEESPEASEESDDLTGYEPINPWNQTSHTEEADQTETEQVYADDPYSYSDDSSDTPSDDETESYSEESYSQSSYAESPEQFVDSEDADRGYVESTYGEADADEDERSEAGSLADMLIQSMGEDAPAETDESGWNLEKPDYDEPQNEYDEAESQVASSQENAYDSVLGAYSDDESGETLGLESEQDYESYGEETSYADETAYENESAYSDDPTSDQGPSVDTSEPENDASQPSGEDDSIEDYMNRLLQRVQGDDDSPEEDVPNKMSSTAHASSLADMVEEEEEPDADAPFVPKSQAPERNTDMSAMRELANESARSAVARSNKMQARDTQVKAMTKFVFAAVTALCAVLCYFFLANAGAIAQWFGVAMAMLVTIILAQEGLGLLKEANSRAKTGPRVASPDIREINQESDDGENG